MKHPLFITGISTDVGKTVVSAILAEALQAYYWKPVQAGDLEHSDSIKIKQYCTNSVTILNEKFRLTEPMSPHAAAEIDNVKIAADDFKTPKVEGNLVIEGAGGLMVPLNSSGLLVIDLIEKNDWPIILVSRHYLGSINHTLLSLEGLKNRKITIAGIIFVGDENPATEAIVAAHTKVPVWGRIPLTEKVDKTFVQQQATLWKENGFLKALQNGEI